MSSLTSFEILENESYVTSDYEAPNVRSQVLVNGFADDHDLVTDQFTNQELYQQLKHLISENKELKDKLKKNNNVMLEELNAISQWQKQIAEANHTHRTMLEESVQLNHKLQAEKQELSRQLEECEATIAFLKLPCTKCQEQESKLENLEGEVKKLHDEIASLSSKMKSREAIHTELTKSILETQNLYSDTGIVDDSVVASVFNDDESGYAIVFQADKNPIESPESLLRKEIRKSFALEELLVEEKVISVSLVQSQEELTKLLALKNNEVEEWMGKALQLEENLQNMTEKFQSYKRSIVNIFETTGTDLQNVPTAQSEVESGAMEELDDSHLFSKLKTLVLSITTAFTALQRENEQNLTKLTDTSEALEKMKAEVVKLRLTQEEVNEVAAAVELRHIETVDELTAKFLSVEQQLEVERRRNSSILGGSYSLCDSENIFKEQAEAYKNDFDAEKNSRLAAEQEIERLTTAVQSLSEQLKTIEDKQTLQTSSHGSRKGHRSYKYNKHNSHQSHPDVAETEASAPPEPNMYICPKCWHGFASIDALEKHVDTCLQNDVNEK